MAWLYVPGLKASDSDSALLIPDIERFVSWRGKHMQRRYWQRAWSSKPFLHVLSGMISKPSMANAGVESWISSMLDFLVNHTPSPASEKATPMNDIYGQHSSESSMMCEPPWSSSKTSQGCLLGFDQSEKNYADWVTKLRAEYSARPKSAPATDGSDSSFWPTAVANDDKSPEAHMAMKNRMPGGPRQTITSLQVKVQDWPTPMARVDGGPNNRYHHQNRKAGRQLTTESAIWQTPATDSFRSRAGERKDEMGLDQQARMWTTPQARDTKSGDPNRVGRFGTKHGGANLGDDVTLWPTPASRDYKDSEGMSTTGINPDGSIRQRLDQLPRAVFLFSRLDQATMKDGDTSSNNGPNSRQRLPTATSKDAATSRSAHLSTQSGRHPGTTLTDATAPKGSKKKLNPNFTDWLMGFPPGWTSASIAFAPEETQSSRSRLRTHLSRLLERRV